ncbi:hypothetical protein [Polyangium sp. y55x31]|uniref:hypothetical protein n=1 Tax=Polyangium sp. y55x31 TaxID=3042688 RepID=UPI002483074F|nr:hypothetical protein [Polyangium sp. y55x31]MDI1476491.1 hypothetical protein [Polyangium sp. y55x31]
MGKRFSRPTRPVFLDIQPHDPTRRPSGSRPFLDSLRAARRPHEEWRLQLRETATPRTDPHPSRASQMGDIAMKQQNIGRYVRGGGAFCLVLSFVAAGCVVETSEDHEFVFVEEQGADLERKGETVKQVEIIEQKRRKSDVCQTVPECDEIRLQFKLKLTPMGQKGHASTAQISAGECTPMFGGQSDDPVCCDCGVLP